MKNTETRYEIVATFNGSFTVIEHLPQHLLDDCQFMATHNYEYAWFNWRVSFETWNEAVETLSYLQWIEEVINGHTRRTYDV